MRLVKPKQLHLRIMHLALRWIETDVACTRALSLLRIIADQNSKEDLNMLEPLLTGLPVFLVSLNCAADDATRDLEHNRRTGALLQLLRTLAQAKYSRDRVLRDLKVIYQNDNQHNLTFYVSLIALWRLKVMCLFILGSDAGKDICSNFEQFTKSCERCGHIFTGCYQFVCLCFRIDRRTGKTRLEMDRTLFQFNATKVSRRCKRFPHRIATNSLDLFSLNISNSKNQLLTHFIF